MYYLCNEQTNGNDFTFHDFYLWCNSRILCIRPLFGFFERIGQSKLPLSLYGCISSRAKLNYRLSTPSYRLVTLYTHVSSPACHFVSFSTTFKFKASDYDDHWPILLLDWHYIIRTINYCTDEIEQWNSNLIIITPLSARNRALYSW